MEKEYYGKNYEKAMENIRKEQGKMRADFLKRYPNADISKFQFDVTVTLLCNVAGLATNLRVQMSEGNDF